MDNKILGIVENFIGNIYATFCDTMNSETEKKLKKILEIINK